MSNIPRLSGAIRAFSGVTNINSNFESQDELLKKRQYITKKKTAVEGSGWQKLVEKVEKESSITLDELKGYIRDLLLCSRQIVGESADIDVVESAAVYLFSVFKLVDKVGQKETSSLKSVFGPFPATVATKACSLVHKITSSLPEDVTELLGNQEREEADGAAEVHEFGHLIKFEYPKCNTEMELSGSESEDEQKKEVNMQYTASVSTEKAPRPQNKNESQTLDSAWLQQEVEKYYGSSGSPDLGLSLEDLSNTIFEVLSSTKSDSELQNDLFELLGFDRFELIKSLLENRQPLLYMATREPDTSVQSLPRPKLEGSSRPAYGCQVTVQTRQEKELLKQIRKEEKKFDKPGSRGDEGSENAFNPAELRAHREIALRLAAMTPIFSGTSALPSKDSYPHVYDKMMEARLTSAFIGGVKMSLPDSVTKNNNKIYEEVILPPSDAAPTHVGEHRVKVEELDEIAQIAFKGTKVLNRIQSVVFSTAYKSNENLLICAPTGAGKTNIAMLTILHELKQHISEGVIKKDEFKIIYVAPMKALAAEMVRNFGGRLEPLGISVRELTGDMSLTKSEILKTQMMVTTPEKWDVVTRKSTGDVAFAQLVKLLIIDEVHLLHDDRGAVIESLVARTLRQVETSQNMIRIVGLSATLPNYLDVARFLHVNPYSGLFFFDGRFRPVPLGMSFIGIKTTNRVQQLQDFNTVCYDKVLLQVKHDYQVMVFVHARNETVRTAMVLRDLAKNNGDIMRFQPDQNAQYGDALKTVMKSRNKQMKELFTDGFSIHHAGMLRQDRNLVEKYFAAGHIKVLVCTATLAWGINLPAHAVVIKGTQIYDAKKGAFVDLGILDVMQIFGRAGRPQYDTFGHGTIITTHEKLSFYLSLMTRQNPIESQFINSLTDNLNAEVSLGTVTNVEEAVRWLSYTYLYVRLTLNPLSYGVPYKSMESDPRLTEYRTELITGAARQLDKARMIRFDERTGQFSATDQGRIASHFYIKYDTVEVINDHLKSLMTEADIFALVSQSQEFHQIKVRDEEMEELEELHHSCEMQIPGGVENSYGKVNILLQSFVSRRSLEGFSLVSDQAYVAQNAARITRALFEVCLKKGWPVMASRLLNLSKTIDKRIWGFESPLRQFSILTPDIINKIEARKLTIDQLKEMTSQEIGHMIHHVKMGSIVKKCAHQLPRLELEATIQPITRTVLRVRLIITPDFKWDDKVHGTAAESFWIWVEDPDNNYIYHSEYYLLHKKQMFANEPLMLVFTIPIFEPLPSQYYVKAISDRWLGSETTHPVSFQHLILPEQHPPHTELLDLQPLPVTALMNPMLETLYKFTHFNPIQTQLFHVLYYSDHNVLLGAPTGSGKTIAAELAIFRLFRERPHEKAVYIAPLKALVRERMEDWKVRIEEKLGKKVVELTGDVTPDMRAIAKADLIVTTPEKWDGVSRSWQTRNYVKAVSLIIIDEIHLLGNDRGPVLEVIVSRTNFISSHTERKVRVVGLSTALANARDLADWLGIGQVGLYNFRPSVRPVPLEVHIHGFPGQHYCPRMATMNKPTFHAIKMHSPNKPVLVFVSSRRQTRLTALDLIAFLAGEDNPKQWLHMPENEMENIITGVKDTNLKLTLAFGIGIHHAGLVERDRKITEELFVNCKIQLLIATSTLAWGVNFPAHLVVVKGTEFYDGKTRRYIDFPITDVLQMMGRAGRPQFDDQGKAVILVHDIKKHFYKKFLYEPFPVESNLLEVLPDHLNAEIVAGTISSKQDAMDYITWTYFFRRLLMNPSYYKLDATDHNSINQFLSALVEKALFELENSHCIETGEDGCTVLSQTLGRMSSYYYLTHLTMRMFTSEMGPTLTIPELIDVLSNATEYAELPVRHNEDQTNSDLAKQVPLEVNPHTMDSPHTKTNLLLQCHFGQIPLPCTDYNTDTKSVLDQAIRICQAMLDVSADQGWLATSLYITHLIQMIIQGHWLDDSSLLTIPHVMPYHLHYFRHQKTGNAIETLAELMEVCAGNHGTLMDMLGKEMEKQQIEQIYQILNRLPQIEVSFSIKGCWEGGNGQHEVRFFDSSSQGDRLQDQRWMQVHADQNYVIQVNLARINKFKRNDSRAFAPKFPKSKDEGWFLIIGHVDGNELIALKRVPYVRGKSSAQISVFMPEKTGRVIYTVYLMSDSYLGLDQQYDLHLDVIQPSIEAQVNTELIDALD